MSLVAKISKELANLVQLDPNSFKCDYKVESWSISTLLDYMKRGIVVISEELQRQYVWDDVTASKFIESLMLRLPVPPVMLYVYGDKYYVLDGVQRLTTIVRFFENKLALTGVMWKAVRNKKFRELKEKYQNMFLTATIPVQIVKIEAPREVQVQVYLEVFRRVNLGAKRLKFTDILFCSMPTMAVQLIKDVARSPEFTKLFEPTEKEIRDMKHYFLSLALFLAVEKNEPLNLTASYKQRYLGDIWSLIFNNNAEHLNNLATTVKNVIELALDVGLSREWFTPRHYGIYARQQQKNVISIILTETILLALKNVAKEEKGKLKIDANPEDIKKTIYETISKFTIDGKTIREVYNEITKNGKTRYLKALYERLLEALKLVAT